MKPWKHCPSTDGRKLEILDIQHFQAQKHQFALYIKNKDTNFLESLLQQLNFGEVEEAVLVEGSEDPKAEGEFE